MDDFSYPGLVNSFGVPPSPANFPRPLKRKAASVFEQSSCTQKYDSFS
jgi:hypothetical protein